MQITGNNQTIGEFMNNKMQKSSNSVCRNILTGMWKETKIGQTVKSVITPVAHNPLLTDVAAPKTAASDQIRNELLNLPFSA